VGERDAEHAIRRGGGRAVGVADAGRVARAIDVEHEHDGERRSSPARIGPSASSDGARRASSTGQVTGGGGVTSVPVSSQRTASVGVWRANSDGSIPKSLAAPSAIPAACTRSMIESIATGVSTRFRAHAAVARRHAGDDRDVVRPRDGRVGHARGGRDAAHAQLVEVG